MSEFADLRDGGVRLADPLRAALSGAVDPVLVPALPNGVPVVLGIRSVLDLPVVPVEVDRTDAGVVAHAVPSLAGRTAVVVDDGVESGAVARAAVVALRASGVARLVLAVPVCPDEAFADLQSRYDAVVAATRSIDGRTLASHYAHFDTIDEAEARRLLSTLPA